MKLQGRITISKVSGRDDNQVYLDIEDVSSGCRVVHVDMTLENFAEALFGRGWNPCNLEVFPEAPIGMKAENKTEIAPFDCYASGRKDDAKVTAALKPFEVDGWRARREDMRNGHCRTPQGQRVTFFRHVHPVTGVPIER
jgi:hypothetical protein